MTRFLFFSKAVARIYNSLHQKTHEVWKLNSSLSFFC